MANNPEEIHLGPTARLVKVFLLSKLPTIIILVSLLAGLMALLYTPREEDPQIKVPMVDILIRFPGASPTEVENLVVINLEKKLWEMEGLEDLYSQARDGFAIVTAKFKVGENLETSLFKVYNKVFSNHRPGAPGRGGLGGQAHEHQRRARRHPDPLQQRRG